MTRRQAALGDDGGYNAGEACVLFGGRGGLDTGTTAVIGTDGDPFDLPVLAPDDGF